MHKLLMNHLLPSHNPEDFRSTYLYLAMCEIQRRRPLLAKVIDRTDTLVRGACSDGPRALVKILDTALLISVGTSQPE
jgi:hypothetical protein